MFDRIKQHILNRLINEISCLDAAELEVVADNVISYKEAKRLIHRGVNKNYKPVKSTIDAYTDDSTIAVECSTDQKYFLSSSSKGATSPRFVKVENDIYHAINHKPPTGPDKIYLITNQEEIPGFRSQFNATPVFAQHGNKIIIYDSRELAKLIYDQARENKNMFAFYREAFPDFAANMDNYEYYGKVPSQCTNHINTPEIVNLIARHFSSGKPICILHGISGSGKTQSAIQYIHSEKDEYDNILWLAGEDWKPDTTLSSIHRTRGGAAINVSGIFNTQKTLLVVDSLERVLDNSILSELETGFVLGGRILITSQIAAQDQKYLPIPDYSRGVAIDILGEREGSISPNGERIIRLCSSLPLILSTIRNIVEMESVPREELYGEILAHPENISDNDAKSIVGRILSKLEPNILVAFKKIANTGSSYHDSDFLVHFIGGLLRSNLQRISLLLPAGTPGILKAHDLLLSSVRDNTSFAEISQGIESYLQKRQGEMAPSILREIHLCYSQLRAEDTHRGDRIPDWLTYALIQIEDGFGSDIYQRIYSLELEKAHSLSAIMSIIDAKEAYAYTLSDKDRDSYYKQCLAQYQAAYESSDDHSIRLVYLHHIGKAQRRCGQYEEALHAFNAIITEVPDSHAALGQVAHLGAQEGAPIDVYSAGEVAIRKLLDFIFSDRSRVPLRVALAMIARLRSYKSVQRELANSSANVQKLSEVIAISGLEGFSQFFEAYVSFTSMFAYEHRELAIDMADQLFMIFMQTPSTVDERQWLSACEGLTNTANAAKYGGRVDLFEKLKDAALQYASQIEKRSELDNYEGRVLAKAYLSLDDPRNALLVIDKLRVNDFNHWVQYLRAKARYQTNDYSSAELDAKEALDDAQKDEKAVRNLSAYFDLYSKCLEENGKIHEALSELEKAIVRANGRYKISLEKRKSTLEGKL
jgi:tetratricopeptide (TPR) repeat protein